MDNACQRCHKAKATVFVTDMMPQKRDRQLCEACAQKEGIIVKQSQPTAAILQEFIKQKTGMAGTEELACSQCGASFREFQLKGLLGCPHDYEEFRALLLPLIEKAHEGGKQHTGKSPRDLDPVARRLAGIKRLRRELEEALQQENYERAASVRDQIRTMETA